MVLIYEKLVLIQAYQIILKKPLINNKIMSLKYKHTAKTLAEWIALNPVILENEIVVEKDTNKLKIGNGSLTYSNLAYVNADHFENAIDHTNVVPANSTSTIILGKVNRIILQLLNLDETIIYDHKEVFTYSPSSYVYLNKIDIDNAVTKIVSIAVEISKDSEGISSAMIDEKAYNTMEAPDFSTFKIRIIAK